MHNHFTERGGCFPVSISLWTDDGGTNIFFNLVSCLLTNKAKNKSECLSLMDDLSNEDCDEDMKYLTMCGITLSGNISTVFWSFFRISTKSD